MPAVLRLAFVALLAACLTACGPSGIPLSPSGPVSIDGPSGLGPVNAFRAQNGLRPLAIDSRLMEAARQHSARQAASNRMDHNLGGALPARLSANGYRYNAAAENLGGGYPSYASAMQGWTRSAGHRRNLLRPEVTHMGVAVQRSATGVPYWTQIFAAGR